MENKLLELTQTNLDEANSFITNFQKYKINYLTFIDGHAIIEVECQGEKYVIELENVIGFNNRGLLFNNLSRYAIQYESSQAISLGKRLKKSEILTFPQLNIWDKTDDIMPKADFVFEKLFIKKPS